MDLLVTIRSKHCSLSCGARIPRPTGMPKRYYLRMDADMQTPPADPFGGYVELAAEVLGLLSDPTRIRIVLALQQAGELSVNALAELVSKKPSGVSQHLARLRMARMVLTRQVGTSVLYRLTDEHIATLVAEAIKQAEHAVAHGHLPPHHASVPPTSSRN